MHCVRRAALRSAIAASRQVVPRTTATPFAAQTVSKTLATKRTPPFAARCFSQTARSQNAITPEEQAESVEEPKIATQVEQQQFQGQDAKIAENGSAAGTDLQIYVGNMDFGVTKEQLATAFSKYGEVEHVSIPCNSRGPQGYAFVTFTSRESAEEACRNVHDTFWYGRRLIVAPANSKSKEPAGGPRIRRIGSPTSSIFVGNIPYDTTDAELSRLFRDLQNVTGVRIAVDRTTGWPRGFAHADFASVEAARVAFEKLQGVSLGGRTLRIDFATGARKPTRRTESKKATTQERAEAETA